MGTVHSENVIFFCPFPLIFLWQINTHCNKIQRNQNSSSESNIRILKAMNYRKKCITLFLFLSVNLLPKLVFLILGVPWMYLLLNLVKTTKFISLPLWWRTKLTLDITSHADHYYFSSLSFNIIFIIGPIRDLLFSSALPVFLNAKKEAERQQTKISSHQNHHIAVKGNKM